MVRPSPTAYAAKPVDSYAKFMGGAFRLVTLGRRFYRPIGIERKAVKGGWSYPVNEWIDASVFERCRRDPEYRPPNLIEWQARRGLPAVERIVGEQRA
jgi:hypothetical protein